MTKRKRRRRRRRRLFGAAKAAHEKRIAKGCRKRRTRRKGNTSMAKRRRRRRRRGGGGNRGTRRLRVLGAGAAYGYLKAKTQMLAQVPVIEGIGRDATSAVALHFLAKYFRSRWLDDAATAVAGHVGVEFGEAGMNMQEFASMSGDDELESGEISGVLG